MPACAALGVNAFLHTKWGEDLRLTAKELKRIAKDGCSFIPSTQVLMADGKTKPIGKIAPGDKVQSANPLTGSHKGTRTVTATHINHDDDLLDLTVETSPGHISTLHTTDNHPFWDDTTHTWVPAGDLTLGDALETARNTHVHVALHAVAGATDMYNLTIDQLHTYYVLAGATPVLVHNCGNDPEAVHLDLNYKDGWDADQKAAADGKVEYLDGLAKNGDLVKTDAVRVEKGSAAGRLRKAGQDVPSGSDGDHMRDLQLGGSDTLDNLSPLEASVNRSLGPQIAGRLRGLPNGTRICGVSIC